MQTKFIYNRLVPEAIPANVYSTRAHIKLVITGLQMDLSNSRMNESRNLTFKICRDISQQLSTYLCQYIVIMFCLINEVGRHRFIMV